MGAVGWAMTANGCRVSFWGDGDVLEYVVVTVSILKTTELYTFKG